MSNNVMNFFCLFLFPLRVYFLFYFYCYGLSICIDKCEHTLKIQNVNFDCLDELLLNNNTCMSKIINPIRTIMSSMSLHHQLLSSLVRTIISPELYTCTSNISNINIFNINLSLIYLNYVDNY